MKTTSLFVELVVIGAGAAASVALFLLGLFGSQLQIEKALHTGALLPILTVVYLLGILTDRIADKIFSKLWDEKHMKRFGFGTKKQYFDTRRELYMASQPLSDLMAYGRSRLRICRGWALNSVLLAMSLNVLVRLQIDDSDLSLWIALCGTAALLGLAYVCWLVWEDLNKAIYRQLRDNADFFKRQSDETTAADRGSKPHVDVFDNIAAGIGLGIVIGTIIAIARSRESSGDDK